MKAHGPVSPMGSTPGLPETGRNCGGPLGPGVFDSWDIGVPGFIPGVLDFSLWREGEERTNYYKMNKEKEMRREK